MTHARELIFGPLLEDYVREMEPQAQRLIFGPLQVKFVDAMTSRVPGCQEWIFQEIYEGFQVGKSQSSNKT